MNSCLIWTEHSCLFAYFLFDYINPLHCRKNKDKNKTRTDRSSHASKSSLVVSGNLLFWLHLLSFPANHLYQDHCHLIVFCFLDMTNITKPSQFQRAELSWYLASTWPSACPDAPSHEPEPTILKRKIKRSSHMNTLCSHIYEHNMLMQIHEKQHRLRHHSC